jgi:hypothetical protein
MNDPMKEGITCTDPVMWQVKSLAGLDPGCDIQDLAEQILLLLGKDTAFIGAWHDVDPGLCQTGEHLFDKAEFKSLDYWRTLIKISSMISNHIEFSDSAKQFIHHNYMMYSSDDKNQLILDVIKLNLTMVDKPSVVFSRENGALYPISIALRHLGVRDIGSPDLFESIRAYALQHLSGQPESELIRVPRYSSIDIDREIEIYCKAGTKFDLDKLADLSYTFSFIAHKDLSYRPLKSDSLAEKILSNAFVADVFVQQAVQQLFDEKLLDVPSLVALTTDARTFRIASTFVTPEEFLRHGSRWVRGQVLQDGLGM